MILDFEGEPTVPLEERRAPTSPLADVAGMLRSLHYVSAAAEADATWEEDHRREFLAGYQEEVDSDLLPDAAGFEALLRAFELRKALYEVRYERAHRPDWEWIPLEAIARLTRSRAP